MLSRFRFLELMRRMRQIDFNRPGNECFSCGHRTYMLKGSMTEDVCPWCALVRILEPLLLPIEVLEEIFGKVTELVKVEQKGKLKL